MKGTTFVAGLVAVVMMATFPAAVEAQVTNRLSANGRGGVAVPTSDLADLTDAGPTVGASVRYRVAPRVAVRVDAELDLLSGLDSEEGQSATPDVELWRALAGVDVSVLPSGSPLDVTAHVTGGLTSYNTEVFPEIVFDPATGDAVGDFSATYPTVSAGLEAGYSLARSVDVFAHGAWTTMLTDEDETAIFGQVRSGTEGFEEGTTVPVTLGARLTF